MFELEDFLGFFVVQIFGVLELMFDGIFINFGGFEGLLSGGEDVFEIVTLIFEEIEFFC